MPRLLPTCVVALSAITGATLRAQEPVAAAPQPAVVRDIQIAGTKELSPRAVREALPARVDEPFTATEDQVVQAIERLYHGQGYTFARAKAAFDAAAGRLTITIDEGVIDGVEFDGVDDRLAQTFADAFALRAGDVFNRRRARQALNALLRPTRGAVTPARISGSTPASDTGEREEHRRTSFDLIERNGQRILRVGLREPAGRFKLSPNLGDREDWFTPVDGFVPALDFGAAIFEHERFNHTFVGGHVSIKAGSGNVGYALGIERPFFNTTKWFIGAELHDLTASDDHWQVSSDEAVLAAVGPRRSVRDYYRRRGIQISSAFRLEPHTELLLAWKTERHESLATTTDFSVWNDDEPFRPNPAARAGRLNAVVVGASVDGQGFDRESLKDTYRRHQLEAPFGLRLAGQKDNQDSSMVWRVDWTSEISAPNAFASDFDFRRHIVTARARAWVSSHQEVGARLIGGWSDGILPPQREFGIGGIGSVHGYSFKESVGDTMRLLNLEYAVGWHSGPQLLAFLDAGRTTTHGDPAADRPWLKGVGWGIGLGGLRVDFGYKLAANPGPVQVLVRFGRTF